MLDERGRDIRYLRLSVTDRCNCRCVYCMPEGGVPRRDHGEMATFEELRDIVRAAVTLGVRKVRVTGGEPLVRRGIVRLVHMLAEVPGVEELAMTTNGTLLAPLAVELRDAGLDRLNVSLDTLDADRYRSMTRCGSLEDALAGLRAAREAGLGPTKLNCVLLGGVNEKDIVPLAELARDGADGELGVASVRFIELMPMGACASWPRERFVSADVVVDEVAGLVPAGQDGVTQLYRREGWRGTIGLIRPVSHGFCKTCDRIRVTADGMLKPCLHSRAEISLRGLSGPELVAALRQGIAAKPARHHLGVAHASATPRSMNQIGG
ncbi:GTP 3',8-cyclase MoaA [Olsenella sp. HMSC062G07]|uniref:GTP 3',8-cyclase MoaA n=1 Tax=Olsenella sp. HMSC062G07 TaxID=1739330 RepID=UPI0008A5DBB6|nr:GTP 3',8-cyclase MoaA [Olsenella sp. HMSC062G07]OFK23866.1 cyclic pyranopterin phosphate synthase MoaA [Olsenella sp. HMSC062G07]